MRKSQYAKVTMGVAAVICAIVLLTCGARFVKVVDAGDTAVATCFGSVVAEQYDEGLHIPVNPFYAWTDYNTKEQKLAIERIPVPTADQQVSDIDVTVIFELNPAACPAAKTDVGNGEAVIAVKLIPNLRSLMRSVGKSVATCEELFDAKIQAKMQNDLTMQLQTRVGKYMTIKAVLLRRIDLPTHIKNAIISKKVREQEAEEEKAKLELYATQQQQQKAKAVADREASEEEAKQVKILADADAYAIRAINDAVAGNPAYIKLKALEALAAISKDPASKIYFMDGNSPMPLPLLHLGDDLRK